MANVEAAKGHEKHSLKERAKEEMVRFFVMFLYLWFMFSLFQLHKYLILAEESIPFEGLGVGFVNALVFAKIMVVADGLKFGAYFRDKPLIAPILTRAFSFALLFIVVDILEKLVLGSFHHQAVRDSLPKYGSGNLAGAAMVGVIMAFALIPFFAFQEIDQALGVGKLRALLLSKPGEKPAQI